MQSVNERIWEVDILETELSRKREIRERVRMQTTKIPEEIEGEEEAEESDTDKNDYLADNLNA